MVQHITDNNFNEEVVKAEGVTIVDFWAPWCGPCKMIGPIFEDLSTELTNVKFAKVNVDENPSIANTYKIVSIPTLLIFKNGAPVDTLVGFMPKPQLKGAIEKHL